MSQRSADDTSRQRIYREIRRSIIMGHCRPGDRLEVQALAQAHDVSATPVREALQMLSQQGLVDVKPRSGYFVTRVTLKELQDLLELREVLELACVKRAATRITEEQLEQLAHVHAGYTGDDDESYDRYTEENRRFHYLVAQASGNEELARTLVGVHDRLASFMVLRHAGETQEIGHARIVEALRSRDTAAAHRAMLREISETRDTILNRVVLTEGAHWQLGAHAMR